MRLLMAIIAALLTAGCGSPADVGTTESGETVALQWIELPAPDTKTGATLTDTLTRRRSVRNLQSTPLSIAELSQLLWAAQGVTSDAGQRTAPSAGALYPLELYVVTADGLFHYDPDRHGLEVVGERDLRVDLYEAALEQEVVAQAGAVFVITAVFSRTEAKYGERAERYVKVEAGHAAQNLLLQAVSLDLGAVPVGAFDDAAVQKVMDLPDDHEPLYLIPAGYPRG